MRKNENADHARLLNRVPFPPPELWLVPAHEPCVELEARHVGDFQPGTRVLVRTTFDELAAASRVGEHSVDVDTHVTWPVPGQLPLCLLELRADATWVTSLGVYERAGVEDQALVEVAPPLAPWALEHLMALPVLLRIEQLEKAVERLRKVLEVKAAALRFRVWGCRAPSPLGISHAGPRLGGSTHSKMPPLQFSKEGRLVREPLQPSLRDAAMADRAPSP